MPTGYSGTPLAKKLGIKPGNRIKLVNEPKHYKDLFDDWPEEVQIESNGTDLDFVHLFITKEKELEPLVRDAMTRLKKVGMVWISWPKGASKIETDLNRDMIREAVLNIGLVDVKVAAVDEDWSGLKFMYRKKDR